MSDHRPSSTAIGAAIVRAAHRLLDQPPGSWMMRMQAEFAQCSDEAFANLILRAAIPLRDRHAEEQL